MMKPYKAVLFDAGNTLVHINMPFISQVLKRFGVHKSAEELQHAEYRVRLQFDREDVIRTTTDSSRFPLYFQAVLNEVVPQNAPSVEQVLKEIQDYMHRNNLWDLLPSNVIPFLSLLRRQGYKLGIITNAPGTATRLFDRMGLLPHVDIVIESALVRIEKPDPRIFHLALEQLKVRPEQSLFVGDLYHVDVVGAEAAGMTGVLLDPADLQSHRPCPRIRTLEELTPILNAPSL